MDKNLMDKIWDRNPSKSKVTLAVVTGKKTPNDHAEPTWDKSLNAKKQTRSSLIGESLHFVGLLICVSADQSIFKMSTKINCTKIYTS